MTAPTATDRTPCRTIVVTGASSGIGRASAIELARAATRPSRLILVARRREELQRTEALVREADRGGLVECTIEPVDLVDPDAVAGLIARIRRDHVHVDALVNNAGVGSSSDIADAGHLEDVDRLLALNLRSPIALAHGLLPALTRGQGSIVNVSSVAGLVGTPHSPVYSSTKWALTGYSEALRAQLAPRGVRVVAIHPGPVPTPGWPHRGLVARPVAGRLLASRADVVARAVARAVDGRGPAAPVLPRTYLVFPVLRGLAPPLLRAMLAAMGRRAHRARSTDRPSGATQ